MDNTLTRLKDGGLEFTQDVLIQSFKDEFDISDKKWSATAAPGSVLEKVKAGEESLSVKFQTSLQSGIGKDIHIIQWSRPETMDEGNNEAIKAIHRRREHCVGTPTCGVTLRPEGSWDGTKD